MIAVERRPRPTLALVVAGASLVLSLVACAFVAGTVDLLPVQSEPAPASAAEVEATAHVTLPPGTVFLSAVYSNGLETRLSATFRIPRDRLDAFVAGGAFTAPVEPGRRAVTDDMSVGQGTTWHPDRAVSVSGIAEEGRWVLFDLDAPDAVTVYLVVTKG